VEVKAFLLVAGKGTRLRPLTDKIPKCLVPIRGEPILGIWLRLCRLHRISEVLINLHSHPEQVREFLASHSFGLDVTASYEEELLGSAGTVRDNRDFVADQDSFFIIYGDNLTTLNLTRMARFHERHRDVMTVGLFRAPEPSRCGIAELDSDGTIVSFVEKPELPKSNLANAGVYLARRGLFDFFPKRGFADFGADVLPKLVGRMRGYLINEHLIDIGTHESYARTNRERRGV
jgi:mannose-1-phosphate guanylyltransferase